MGPKISLVLPVYNVEKHLEKALLSILGQTYANFELIVINDGSRDKSQTVIKKYADLDKRIRVVTHKKNQGLIASLNEGVMKASGKYIGRHDADDISLATRLEKQVAYLEANPLVGLVGTNYHIINEQGTIVNTTDVFTVPEDLKLAEIFTNQFGHGTILAKTELLREYPYDPSHEHAEDYDLWARLSHEIQLANLKEPLYQWRLHEGGVTSSNTNEMQSQAYRIRDREFDYFLKNRSEFRSLSFHPWSTRKGVAAYLGKKASLFRDVSLMFCYRGLRKKALAPLLLALVLAPWEGKTYRQLLITAFRKEKIASIVYETI